MPGDGILNMEGLLLQSVRNQMARSLQPCSLPKLPEDYEEELESREPDGNQKEESK